MEDLRFHESQNPADPTGKTSPSKFCSSVFAEPDGEIGSRIPMDIQELIHGEAAEVLDITTAGSLERGLQGNSMGPRHVLMSCKASTRDLSWEWDKSWIFPPISHHISIFLRIWSRQAENPELFGGYP